MNIKECTQADIPLLAQMNKRLIEDENADNPMNDAQLAERMAAFLADGYRAYVFQADNRAIGYALCDMKRNPVYLRQFYVERSARRQGFGTQAFRLLTDCLGTEKIDLDVYVWNERGIRFWESLGFEKRCYAMRYRSPSDDR